MTRRDEGLLPKREARVLSRDVGVYPAGTPVYVTFRSSPYVAVLAEDGASLGGLHEGRDLCPAPAVPRVVSV